jgi:hypothetical protein
MPGHKPFSRNAGARPGGRSLARGSPWVSVAGMMNDRLPLLMGELGELGGALVDVAYTGSDTDVAEARLLLARTRRAIYRLMAAEPEDMDQQ